MKRSVLALVGSLVGLAYLGLVAFALTQTWDFGAFSIQMLGHEIQIARVLPFLLAVGLADVSGWIGFFSKKRACSLAAALLYGAALPVLPVLIYASAALAAFSLADFLFYPALTRVRETPAPASTQPESMNPTSGDDATFALPDDPSLTLDGVEMPEDAFEPGEPEEDMDIQETPIWLDDAEERKTPPERSPTDGTGVFLGVFMALAALVLAGVVIYGLIAGKLPLMP